MSSSAVLGAAAFAGAGACGGGHKLEAACLPLLRVNSRQLRVRLPVLGTDSMHHGQRRDQRKQKRQERKGQSQGGMSQGEAETGAHRTRLWCMCMHAETGQHAAVVWQCRGKEQGKKTGLA